MLKANIGERLPTTVDENGKFSYISADMRPVPPGEEHCTGTVARELFSYISADMCPVPLGEKYSIGTVARE